MLAAVRSDPPDVRVTDLSLPGRSGLEVARTIRHEELPTNVVLFAPYYSDTYVVEACEAGAHGYVVKGEARDRLDRAVRAAAAGDRHFCDQVACHPFEEHVQAIKHNRPRVYDRLTKREREVLFLIAQALDAEAIGDRLGISHRTVEKHREHLYQKTGTSNLKKLMRFGFLEGFVPLPHLQGM